MIVSLDDIDRFRAARVRPGDRVLEVENPRGFRLGVGHAGEFQHGGDVGLVLRPDFGHARGRVEVVLAVRHAETALQQERGVFRRLVQVLRHPETEQVAGVEVRGVEHVHVGAQRAADRPGQRLLVRDTGDAVERGFERPQPLALDGRFVHVARVVVPDLPRLGAGGRPAARRFLDQLGRPLTRQLVEHGADAVGTAVGRDLGRLQPGSVRVGEEVVARRDGAVHAVQINAARGRRGCGGTRFGEGGRREGQADEDSGGAGKHGTPVSRHDG